MVKGQRRRVEWQKVRLQKGQVSRVSASMWRVQTD